MAKLRAAVITDIHYGFDKGPKLGSKAPRLMDYFVKAVGKLKYKPDLVVDGGDRVSHKSKEDDRRYMTELKAKFNALAAPVYHIVGNHDVKNLSRQDNEDILGCPATSYSKDIGGYHLVFWNPYVSNGGLGLAMDDADLEWLHNDLQATDKPTVVFSHIPLFNEAMDDSEMSTWSGEIATRFFYPDSRTIRRILEDSGKVVLCMSGHLHRKRHKEINGIHYISQQSFTHEHQKKYRVPSRAWSILDMEDDKITVSMQGKVRKTYELTARPVTPANTSTPPAAGPPPPDVLQP